MDHDSKDFLLPENYQEKLWFSIVSGIQKSLFQEENVQQNNELSMTRNSVWWNTELQNYSSLKPKSTLNECGAIVAELL